MADKRDPRGRGMTNRRLSRNCGNWRLDVGSRKPPTLGVHLFLDACFLQAKNEGRDIPVGKTRESDTRTSMVELQIKDAVI